MEIQNNIFADRITDVPKSFIREILKVAIDPNIISFAGGLPNRELFPIHQLRSATLNTIDTVGSDLFQYSNSEGYLPLRQYIAKTYKEKDGLDIDVNNIMIISGSQQGLDLLGKTFLNDKDDVIIEEPGYLGAIQAFSVYKASFNPITLNKDGIDLAQLQNLLTKKSPKLFYMVPNFQNPTGISYSEENRKAIASLLKDKNTFIVEDNPYGALQFEGEKQTSFKKLLPDQTILLGSFSKTVVPSFRIGWIVAPSHIMDRLLVAKQASDLHTSFFTQRILYQYLCENDLNQHIEIIKNAYGAQCKAMINAIKNYFPSNVDYTTPQGGMFLWVTLPKGYSAMQLFEKAIAKQVAFVPGNPFYVNKSDTNTLRLNFTCTDEATTIEGIKRLAKALEKCIGI